MSILILGPGPVPGPGPNLSPIPDPVPSLVDTTIIQDQGPLEVEAIVGVIEKIAIVTVDTIEVKDAGIVRINVSVNIIQWPHLQLLL